jgi:hypothetical protein
MNMPKRVHNLTPLKSTGDAYQSFGEKFDIEEHVDEDKTF